jgi:hypothetical protein
MAEINHLGNVTANCPGCNGALSSFQWRTQGLQNKIEYGAIYYEKEIILKRKPLKVGFQCRLYRCMGCGRGALAVIMIKESRNNFPDNITALVDFYPETSKSLPLPSQVPQNIVNEFREAEKCISANCYRAAAAMFRSVLDKVFRENGYKTKDLRNLIKQIDVAHSEGIITESRKKKAHADIRVLGNDVLHDEWRKILKDEVGLSHHYTQRVIEDFYDDRETVEKILITKERIKKEPNNI